MIYKMIHFGFVFFGMLFLARILLYMYVYVCPSSVCRMLAAIVNSSMCHHQVMTHRMQTVLYNTGTKLVSMSIWDLTHSTCTATTD